MTKTHEEKLEYYRKYRRENRLRVLGWERKWRRENRQKACEHNRKYHQAHKQQINGDRRNLRRELRQRVFEKLGNKCVRCGFSDVRALQIDHVHGGGVKECGKIGSTIMLSRKVLADTEGNYQLLCANCNWIKRDENNERGGTKAW